MNDATIPPRELPQLPSFRQLLDDLLPTALWGMFLGGCAFFALRPSSQTEFTFRDLLIARFAWILIPIPAVWFIREGLAVFVNLIELSEILTVTAISEVAPPLQVVLKLIMSVMEVVGRLPRLWARWSRSVPMALVSVVLVVVFFLLDAPVTFASRHSEQRLPDVLYATSRKHSTDPSEAYAGDPDVPRQTLYGKAAATQAWNLGPLEFTKFPLGTVFIWLDVAESPSLTPRIVSRSEFNQTAFVTEANAAVSGSQTREALLFVHGFNTPFMDALRRTAQLAGELKFAGAPILFTWPSNGSYGHDEKEATNSVGDLNALLDLVIARNPSSVHLLAHSMGGQLMVRVLSQRMPDPQPVRNVVLFAPDVDLQTFDPFAASAASLATRVTLYVSQWDVALATSVGVNLADRVGRIRQVHQGIDVVDTRGLDTKFAPGWGHSYVFNSELVLRDVFDLLAHQSPPSSRAGLQLAQDGVWDFVRRAP